MELIEQKIKEIVQRLTLIPHPEGGYYKETYRSQGSIPNAVLAPSITGDRNYCTAIYFLLSHTNFSAFHRIQQDETWHHYDGGTLYVHVIHPDGTYQRFHLGKNFDQGEEPQFTVPAGCWFASSVANKNEYALVGCTVAPGFDFADFELAERSFLSALYPAHKNTIESLTRV